MTWGIGQQRRGGDLTNIETIFNAFAALKNDGTVVTWGEPGYGGDSSDVAEDLTDVQTISSTESAFAALKSDDGGDVGR